MPDERLVDSVLLTRDLVGSYYEQRERFPVPGMSSLPVRLGIEGLDAERDLGDPNSSAMVGGLVKIVESRADCTVRCLGGAESATAANLAIVHEWRSQVVFLKDNRADIYYLDDRDLVSPVTNLCWIRFVIAKELAHVLFWHDNRHATPTTASELAVRISELDRWQWPLGVNSKLETEYLALYTALCLLVPERAYDQLCEMERSGLDHYRIAERFRVPEEIIKARLENAELRGLLDRLRAEMH